MSGQQTNVDVIANNIANVNTSGFKRQRVNFQDLFYQIRTMPGTSAGEQGQNPVGTQIGHGVRVSGTPRIHKEGNVENTGVQTDIRLREMGILRLLCPMAVAYTRAGDFNLDGDGIMVTDGYYLEPRIVIPDETQQISISQDGIVTVLVNGVQSDVGQITTARFRNSAGLVAVGRNLFQEMKLGPPNQGVPTDPGFGALKQGALEKSNVDVVMELVSGSWHNS